MNQPISVCMIVKNEEDRLEKCLSSLVKYGFELVVVDTGSVDRTVEVAEHFGAKVYYFEWCDDFSAARNFSLRQASNNWILMMDSDEWIETIDVEELDYFRKHLSKAVGSVNRRNITGTPEKQGETVDRTERFFDRRLYEYTGRIHEQLTPKHGKEFENYLLNCTIGHSGYCMTEEERKRKADRNVSLLELQFQETPDDPYLLYQLGKGWVLAGDMQKACDYYGKGLEYDLDPELAYVQAMVVGYGDCLLELGKSEEALAFEGIYEDFVGSGDFVYLMGRIYLANKRYQDAIDQFQKATEYEFTNLTGANSYLAHRQIAHILRLAGQEELASQFWELAEREETEKRI